MRQQRLSQHKFQRVVITLRTSAQFGIKAIGITLLSLLVGTPVASAAPGFVASTSIQDGSVYTEIHVRFRCQVQYVGHEPPARSDLLRIRLDPTTICVGASPSLASSSEQLRPLNADAAHLVSLEYDGDTPGEARLTLQFDEQVRYSVETGGTGDSVSIRVYHAATAPAQADPVQTDSGAGFNETGHAGPARLRTASAKRPMPYVINLESRQRPPATIDLPEPDLVAGRRVFVSEAIVDGATWYRIRVGYFESAEQASRELRKFRHRYPNAWIDRADAEQAVAAEPTPALPEAPETAAGTVAAAEPRADSNVSLPTSAQSPSEIEQLMHDAKRSMTAGELSRAVQIYTKVLQLPPNACQPEAQEFLALARERNGQLAHAKAEYQRYLDVYPEEDGADRVRQRLAALLSGASAANEQVVAAPANDKDSASRPRSNWKMRTFLAQYYRRDVNQLNDQEEIVSQSSLYTDASIDLRRRGERFDFSSRITAGYRNSFLNDEGSSTADRNDIRLSYAFADLADARTGLRGRIGRQTRNTGGVLGRFDGVNVAWEAGERLRFDAVTGNPVFSTADDVERARLFYGLSSTFKPFQDSLELGVFALKQDFEGMTDRQSIGAEARYFGGEVSVWGMVDYDTAFQELGIAFLQGSWRLPGNLTVTGLVDHRRSPFLMLGNSVIGQLGEEFSTFSTAMTEDELRQLALDRSAIADTLTFGVSKPFTPRLQLNLRASISSISATPESAGVAATQDSEYSYYSADLVTSSLLTQGDVGILGVRFATTATADIYTFSVDTRFPLGRALRLNPRIRVDYRENTVDQSTQWNYRPGLRLQYRWGRHMRLELEAGREFVQRDMELIDQDRESYFVNLGYQFFY